MEERLQAVVSQAETDGSLWHTIIHGNNATSVSTENGKVPSVAKQLKDVRDELINGAADYLGSCLQAKTETTAVRDNALVIKSEIEQLKADTQDFRNTAESYKNMAQTTFNSISSAVSQGITDIQTEGSTQISQVKLAAAEQVAEATAQADRAENAVDSKLNIDCSNINLLSILKSCRFSSNTNGTVIKFPAVLPDNTIRIIIIQFGKIVVNGDSQASFTFPEAFPTAVISTQATFYYGFNNGTDAGCGVHSVTLTGGIAQNGCNWQLGIGWMAIGY